MPALVVGIHAFLPSFSKEGVAGRDNSGGMVQPDRIHSSISQSGYFRDWVKYFKSGGA